jgi:hypothetical protein
VAISKTNTVPLHDCSAVSDGRSSEKRARAFLDQEHLPEDRFEAGHLGAQTLLHIVGKLSFDLLDILETY